MYLPVECTNGYHDHRLDAGSTPAGSTENKTPTGKPVGVFCVVNAVYFLVQSQARGDLNDQLVQGPPCILRREMGASAS